MSSMTIELDGQTYPVRGTNKRFADVIGADAQAQVNPLAVAIESSQPAPRLRERIAAGLKKAGTQFALVFETTPLPVGPYVPPSVAVKYSAGMAARTQRGVDL